MNSAGLDRFGALGDGVHEVGLGIGPGHDEEVSGAVKRLLALLEPALILGLGVLIAGIIVSIMVGIMSVNELVY